MDCSHFTSLPGLGIVILLFISVIIAVKQYLIIFISLMVNGSQHFCLFVCLLFVFFSEMSIQLFCLFKKLSCLFSHWVFRVLYVCWIQWFLFIICILQVTSPTLYFVKFTVFLWIMTFVLHLCLIKKSLPNKRSQRIFSCISFQKYHSFRFYVYVCNPFWASVLYCVR